MLALCVFSLWLSKDMTFHFLIVPHPFNYSEKKSFTRFEDSTSGGGEGLIIAFIGGKLS